MKIWVIGDLHGCYDSFCALLQTIGLRPQDRVICLGDLINRGPKSAQILELFCNDPRFSCILGNHDWAFILSNLAKTGPIHSDFKELSESSQVLKWIAWLRNQPFSRVLGSYFLVHAGCWPLWSLEEHQKASDTLQQWFQTCSSEELKILDRYLATTLQPSVPSIEADPIQSYAFTINVLTKLRYLDRSSQLQISMDCKGPEASNGQEVAWFDVYPVPEGKTIVFGHWSALQGLQRPGFEGLDTGCVWGQSLTAFELHSKQRIIQPALESHAKPYG